MARNTNEFFFCSFDIYGRRCNISLERRFDIDPLRVGITTCSSGDNGVSRGKEKSIMRSEKIFREQGKMKKKKQCIKETLLRPNIKDRNRVAAASAGGVNSKPSLSPP
ncbi:hypothetical protein CEXT_726801 [Caerostris extrusa]|uniref:Uncharacterized protein n=1 Tax=Caerostris extrusa TaxID=172846 RepID=A0AAV4YAZ3_CAEEX|nr:hypothetical protein CEXT_726801 [Caerostris extrusa]